MSAGLLLDTTRCIGCGACTAACKEQNGLPLPIEPVPTAYTWTTVSRRDGVYVRSMCFHCLTPTCVSVCPVGALSKRADGPVVYDAAKCIGCRYCVFACPFGVPKYQWDRPVPVMGKCILCAGRMSRGLAPACASVCPTGATLFGERDALASEARARIDREPGRYVNHVYGLEEAGGTSVLMLSSVPFENIGLDTKMPLQPIPMYTWRVLSHVPDVVLIGAAFLYGVYWITGRREYVARVEGVAREGATSPPARGALRRAWRRLLGREVRT